MWEGGECFDYGIFIFGLLKMNKSMVAGLCSEDDD
jgi:hypothetical protein